MQKGTGNHQRHKKKSLPAAVAVLFLVLVFIVSMLIPGVFLKKTEPEMELPAWTQDIPYEVEAAASEEEEEQEEEGEEAQEEPEDEELPEETEETEEETEEPDETKEDEQESDAPEDPEKDPAGESDETEPGEEGDQKEDPDGEKKPGEAEDGPGGEDEEPKPGEERDPESPEDPETPEDPEKGPEDDTEWKLKTDLADRRYVTYSELLNDILPFEAYLVNAQADWYLKVKIIHSGTGANGTYLTADGRNYETALKRGEKNRITIYVKEGNKTIAAKTYVVEYIADRANEDNPEVGEHPPIVTTNLDGFEEDITNRNFTLTVKARTWQNKVMYASQIEVRMDGTLITGPTGSEVLEYQLYFDNPKVGDDETHTITVFARDDEDNSVFKTYKVNYHFIDTGDEIGTAYIILDATTVGLGVMEQPFAYRIKQNEPASYAVLAMLEAYGYSVTYDKTPDNGFYLKRISRGGLMDYPDIPEELEEMVKADTGINWTGALLSTDSLGEYDYTNGSGWMFTVGGAVYSGKGLSSYFLSDGDTLYLRFTLAYGKDIGGSSNQGGISTYCVRWLNGQSIDAHAWGSQTVAKEATCTENGEMAVTCTKCGSTKDHQVIPAKGHSYQETDRQEATEKAEGWIRYTCQSCGEIKNETIPKKTPESEPETEPSEPETEPTEPETDPTEPETEPTEPETEPTEPETEPTEPAEPETEQTEAKEENNE